MEGIFLGKRALVVGGSGGIGRAVALELAGRGAAVTITGGNSRERLEETLAELNSPARAGPAGRPADKAAHTGFLCRIGGPEGLLPEEAAAFILKKTGSPDILVLAWGAFKKIPLPETGGGDWRLLVESNLLFPGIMVSLVLSPMIQNRWGRILLFGGTKTAEIRGFSDTAAYAAAKTALGSLAKSAAKSAGGAGVTCNVICPGLVPTEYTSPEERAWYQKHNSGAALTTELVARAALALLENPAINGTTLPVDGGLWI